jgi:ankyrin repeat protein
MPEGGADGGVGKRQNKSSASALDRQPDVNARDTDGKTALTHASDYLKEKISHPESYKSEPTPKELRQVIKFLKKNGARE